MDPRGADRGVPTPRSIANLKRIQETQPVQFDIWLYPGGDHSLRAVPSGRRIDYWRRIESWLRSHGFLDS